MTPHKAPWVAGCDCAGCVEYIAQRTKTECEDQGVPFKVTDPAVLDRIAAVLEHVPAGERSA